MDSEMDDSNANRSQRYYRRKISAVWKYFNRIGRDKVQCKICNHLQNYQGTTGNILRHLKSRHDIDATVKGQSDSPQIKIVEKFSQDDAMRVNFVRSPEDKTQRTFEEIGVITMENPYIDANKNFTEYLKPSKEKKARPQGKYPVEEDRIMAEIEYFREKAAYYRMQKNLTALRAKKVRCEIELMS